MGPRKRCPYGAQPYGSHLGNLKGVIKIGHTDDHLWLFTFPITSWEIEGETMETVADFLGEGPPKSLQMVTTAMKLKDTCSLEEKL